MEKIVVIDLEGRVEEMKAIRNDAIYLHKGQDSFSCHHSAHVIIVRPSLLN